MRNILGLLKKNVRNTRHYNRIIRYIKLLSIREKLVTIIRNTRGGVLLLGASGL